ncbi:hypothetical protein D3C87_1365030 [compost metagenome]
MQFEPARLVQVIGLADQGDDALHAPFHVHRHAETLIHAEIARFLHHTASGAVIFPVIGRFRPVEGQRGGEAVAGHRVEMHIALRGIALVPFVVPAREQDEGAHIDPRVRKTRNNEALEAILVDGPIHDVENGIGAGLMLNILDSRHQVGIHPGKSPLPLKSRQH